VFVKQPRGGEEATAASIYLASSRASKEDEARQITTGRGKDWTDSDHECVSLAEVGMRGNQASKKRKLSIEWASASILFLWVHEELGIFASRLRRVSVLVQVW